MRAFPLTGLYNRRHFDAAVVRLERRWHRAPVEQRGPVSVIIFDLDHFGELNKLHGHQVPGGASVAIRANPRQGT